MVKLSIAIITFNEEHNIARCLESVKDIADEVIVVDSFSQDKTAAICREYGVQLSQREFPGHIEQKNHALSLCTHPYILSLDADEALSSDLRDSIKRVKENWQGAGYCFNRLTNYAGHWVRHCGWYPDRKLRLIKKDQAQWQGVNPHDILKLKDGQKETWIPGDLYHYSYDSISDHIRQTNKFTTIAAKASFEKGVRSSQFKIITRPILKFLRDYIFKLGFLDGRYGFIICYINALSAFLKYAKIKELELNKPID